MFLFCNEDDDWKDKLHKFLWRIIYIFCLSFLFFFFQRIMGRWLQLKRVGLAPALPRKERQFCFVLVSGFAFVFIFVFGLASHLLHKENQFNVSGRPSFSQLAESSSLSEEESLSKKSKTQQNTCHSSLTCYNERIQSEGNCIKAQVCIIFIFRL